MDVHCARATRCCAVETVGNEDVYVVTSCDRPEGDYELVCSSPSRICVTVGFDIHDDVVASAGGDDDQTSQDRLATRVGAVWCTAERVTNRIKWRSIIREIGLDEFDVDRCTA